MKKPIKYVLVVLGSIVGLLLVGFVALIIYAKYFYQNQDDVVSYYAEEWNIGKDDFLNEFEELYQITLDNYSLYQSKGLNMDSIHSSLVKRIENPDIDKFEFGNILREFFGALNAGHASVYLRDYTAGYSPVFIEDRIFVDNPNEYLKANGFNDKDEIIGIDGVAIADWLDENEKFTPASTDGARRLMTALKAFRSWSDTIVRYEVIRDADTLEIKLPLKKYDLLPPMQENTDIVEWKIINDSIGYINITSMMDPVTDEFVKAYNSVSSLPYLIVDIRNNGGGNSGNGIDIAEYLIRNPQPHCVDPKRVMEPQPNAYNGQIYLLIDTYTFSAAESFALDIKESNNAILIGSATAGDTGNCPKAFNTSGGIYFRIPTRKPAVSPKGFPMEGTGIRPDYEVIRTVSDFMDNHDTVLDFAVGAIEGRGE